MHMRLFLFRPITGLRRCTLMVARRRQSTAAAKPLRLLYCGSDEFSIASLRAVHQEHLRDPQSIASIDVLVRPGKRTGKAMNIIREVPLKIVAQELGLPIHERDTFTGWTLPRPNGEDINLLVAVSFGLFVPPRILKSVEYGGINIHPSMLPDFRGPAPLHHTLLANDTHTGITIQTLHPEKFDHGRILDQTPPPGLQIPNWPNCTFRELLEFISPKAAEMLVKGIRNRVFINGAAKAEDQSTRDVNGTSPLREAGKITPEDRRIDWLSMQPEEIVRRDRVMGRLWSLHQAKSGPPKRIIFSGLSYWPDFPSTLRDFRDKNGMDDEAVKSNLICLLSRDNVPSMVPYVMGKEEILICASETGGTISVKEITIEGKERMSAAKAMRQLQRNNSSS